VPGGDELPLSFSFPLATKIIASARQGEASLVAQKIAEMQKVYPPGATWVPFLTNHDMQRVATNLKNDPGQLRMAAAVMLTLPGAPFIYYGEEIGMQNGPGDDDEWKRTPMPWDETKTHGFTTGKPWQSFAPGSDTTNVAAQTKDPASLLSHYRRLIRLRHASRAIQRGRLELLTTEGPVLAYVLTDGSERVLVAHNLGDQTAGVAVAATGAATPLLVPEGGRFEEGHISLGARTSAAWKLGPAAH
jgi:alpha-amylase